MPSDHTETKASAQNSSAENNFVDNFRHRLAHIDALPQLTLLGIISGLLAALIILLFRFSIDLPLSLYADGGTFETMPASWRFGLVLGGAFIIGLILHFIDSGSRRLSVAHVLDRLHQHEGKLPFKNIVVQFVGGVLTHVSGQSMGREGPAVHLGAGMASQLGQWLKLPNNSLRTLVGCGVASAISASFDTPIAGVIFAMEVVLLEYTITGFIPVMLASVTGAALAQAAFGNSLSFSHIDAELNSLWELPYIALCGFFIAVAAGLYSRLHLWGVGLKNIPIMIKVMVAGLVTALLTLQLPQVMGDGYDTIMQTATGQLSIGFLLLLVGAKILSSGLASGAGMPGGIIGPCLVIGACLGAALGEVGALLSPLDQNNTELYVLLGMTAMMAAVLNAPLAALLAVLELSHSPGIILPAMLMISTACIFTRQWFAREGIFLAQLRQLGTPIDSSPQQQILSRVGVRSVMIGRIKPCPAKLQIAQAEALLRSKPLWLIFSSEAQTLVMAAADLSRHLEEIEQQADEITKEQLIDLLDIPAKRLNSQLIDQGSNLNQAQNLLRLVEVEVLIVSRQQKNQQQAIGIITADTINNYYA